MKLKIKEFDIDKLVLERIKEKELTAYRIGKDIKIDVKNIQKFINGERKVSNFSLKSGMILLAYLFDTAELTQIFDVIKNAKKS